MKSPRIPCLLFGALLPLAPARGVEIDTSFTPPLPPGTVHSAAVGPDGSLFVAGEFGAVSVLKVTSSEVAEPIRTEGGAFSLAVSGDELCAGGTFGISTRNWNVPANGRVLVVAAAGDKWAVGGTFWSQPGCMVARLNRDGTVDSTFTSGLKPSTSLETGVSTLGLQADGKVIVGGNFNVDGEYATLARLHPDGSVDATFSQNYGAILYPKTIVVLGTGKILVAGTADPSGRGFVRRLNADGTVDSSFLEPSLNGSVEAIAVDLTGRVIVGGVFTVANGATRERLLRLSSEGAIDPNWTITANNVVKAITLSGTSVFAAGAFTEIGGVSQSGLARFEQVSAFGTKAPLRLSLNAETGRTYVIESSRDLQSWSELRRETGGAGGLTVSTAPIEPRLFFRARLAE